MIQAVETDNNPFTQRYEFFSSVSPNETGTPTLRGTCPQRVKNRRRSSQSKKSPHHWCDDAGIAGEFRAVSCVSPIQSGSSNGVFRVHTTLRLEFAN